MPTGVLAGTDTKKGCETKPKEVRYLLNMCFYLPSRHEPNNQISETLLPASMVNEQAHHRDPEVSSLTVSMTGPLLFLPPALSPSPPPSGRVQICRVCVGAHSRTEIAEFTYISIQIQQV